jgi:hypothetical protein
MHFARSLRTTFGPMNAESENPDYSIIDPIIDAWVVKNGFSLFDRIQGGAPSFRSIYLSSQKGECFQIWVDAPASGRVSIHAADVETRNDEELRQDWTVSLVELPSALEAAVRHVRNWMER